MSWSSTFSGGKSGAYAPPRITMSLTTPSLLSRGTPFHFWDIVCADTGQGGPPARRFSTFRPRRQVSLLHPLPRTAKGWGTPILFASKDGPPRFCLRPRMGHPPDFILALRQRYDTIRVSASETQTLSTDVHQFASDLGGRYKSSLHKLGAIFERASDRHLGVVFQPRD